MHPTEDLLYQAAQQGVEPADRYRAPEGMSRSRQEAARRHVSYPVSDSMSCRRRAKQHGSRTVLTSRPRSALCALPPRESELLRHSIPRDSTAACARADRATCSSSGSSPASAAPSSTWSTLCRPCRPAAWVCGCSPGKARRSTPPPRHHRVRALPRTRDHPRDALAVRRAARPVARARPEGSRSANRRAPARTGECKNVLRPAARWPSLGGHATRAAATSGRSCSDGRTVFFNGQAEGPHGAPDRRHTRGRGEGVLQLSQRAIRLRRNQRGQGV